MIFVYHFDNAIACRIAIKIGALPRKAICRMRRNSMNSNRELYFLVILQSDFNEIFFQSSF